MVNSSHVDCENDRTPDPFPPSLLHRQQQTRLWSYPCNRIVSVASNAPSVHTWEPARTANIIKLTMSSVHMQSTTTFCTWKRAIAQVLRCSCSLHKWVSEASDGYCTNAVKERSLLCRSIMILLYHPLSYFIFQWLLYVYIYILLLYYIYSAVEAQRTGRKFPCQSGFSEMACFNSSSSCQWQARDRFGNYSSTMMNPFNSTHVNLQQKAWDI